MSEIFEISISSATQQVISSADAWHYKIVPKDSSETSVTFYVEESGDSPEIRNELEVLLGRSIRFEPINPSILNKALGKYYRKPGVKRSEKIEGYNNDFLARIIAEARSLGSSDIHMEPYEESSRIRIRIDGQLIERYEVSLSEYPGIVNKIKIQANLDISEKRRPQDGRIHFKSGSLGFDIRVSILPTLHGEKIVLRLLSNDATDIDINLLGFSESQLKDYLDCIKKPHGILLISGPTGSGKTTTLYATLKLLNDEKRNIVTIEDPIEYTLPGINQVQLKEDIGLGFASALRTFLRQDPDIIMLGEIRDPETAQMAIRAALTGHLVLSTIHTNSAWATVSRLSDMGVPSFLLSGTLNTTVAQRLVRTLCPDCKRKVPFSISLFPRNFRSRIIPDYHYEPVGCESCYYTGYKGRKAIYEVIPVDHELAELIKSNELNVREQLQERRILTLADNALSMFTEGETSIEEIYSLLIYV